MSARDWITARANGETVLLRFQEQILELSRSQLREFCRAAAEHSGEYHFDFPQGDDPLAFGVIFGPLNFVIYRGYSSMTLPARRKGELLELIRPILERAYAPGGGYNV